MAEVTIKMASSLIGYTNADVTFPVADDITPEEIARLHWEFNLRFLQEQERISKEPVTEAQEAAVTTAAIETVKSQLKATEVATEETPEGEAPWDNPPAERAADEPWKNKLSFDLF